MSQINSDFEKYYLENWELVYRTAFKFLNNREDAKDVTNDVFINLYKYMMQGRTPIYKLRPWLTVSAKNKAISYIRKNKRLVPINSDLPGNDAFSNIYNQVFVSDMLNRLYQHNKRWFDIAEKYYMLDMTVAEIAAEYRCSDQAIRNALQRIKKYLRKEYKSVDAILIFLISISMYCCIME